jgi:tRNA(Ile)-lysidine synthase TilS/MesJ
MKVRKVGLFMWPHVPHEGPELVQYVRDICNEKAGRLLTRNMLKIARSFAQKVLRRHGLPAQLDKLPHRRRLTGAPYIAAEILWLLEWHVPEQQLFNDEEKARLFARAAKLGALVARLEAQVRFEKPVAHARKIAMGRKRASAVNRKITERTYQNAKTIARSKKELASLVGATRQALWKFEQRRKHRT